jgi:hypothetical protein
VLPPHSGTGDLPIGVHRASLGETLVRFGAGSKRRNFLARSLEHMYRLAVATGHLYRFIIFGSFVTDKSEPNDIDVILIMADTFDVGEVTAEAGVLFEHSSAEAYFAATVFWLRRSSILGDEQEFVNYWQIKRGGGRRGILEIISE